MTVVRLDEEDLDDEDRAILAEVRQKGYYHGRPKNEACPPPAKIEPPEATTQPVAVASAQNPSSRLQFDEFQQKWDRFDNDAYLEELGVELGSTAAVGASSSQLKTASAEQRVAPHRQQSPTSHEFKILLAGDGGVGKSSFVRRHLTGEFERAWVPTSGLRVHPLTFTTDCGTFRFNVWDLGLGERHYRQGCIQNGHFTGGHGAIIMFDRTSSVSHRNVPNWHREIVLTCGAIPTVIVGNKIDVRYVHVKAKNILFHRRKLQYYDLSVQTRFNIEKPFLWLARRLANQPELQFTQPFAECPWVRLDPELFARHERELCEAQRVPVVNGGEEDEL